MTKQNIEKALVKLDWTRRQHIWPNGRRYLWTDAFGVVLLISLHRELAQQNFLDDAEVPNSFETEVVSRQVRLPPNFPSDPSTYQSHRQQHSNYISYLGDNRCHSKLYAIV